MQPKTINRPPIDLTIARPTSSASPTNPGHGKDLQTATFALG